MLRHVRDAPPQDISRLTLFGADNEILLTRDILHKTLPQDRNKVGLGRDKTANIKPMQFAD